MSGTACTGGQSHRGGMSLGSGLKARAKFWARSKIIPRNEAQRDLYLEKLNVGSTLVIAVFMTIKLVLKERERVLFKCIGSSRLDL